MTIPPNLLEIRRCHIAKAIEASCALKSGFITSGECAFIIDTAAGWCDLVYHLHGSSRHGPLASLLFLLLELAVNGP